MRLKRLAGFTLATMLAMVGIAVGAQTAQGDQRVVAAAKAQDADAVRALLAKGADANARQSDGATALHWAAYWDDVETAGRLIRAGARVNVPNDLGATPLWVAANNGSASLIQLLLSSGADPNLALREGETPLMTAARSGSADGVKALLEHGAHPNAAELVRGQTALMWAAAQHHPEAVQVLLQHGADVRARSSMRVRSVKLKGADQTSRVTGVVDEEQGGYTPLLFAARTGDAESTKLLLAAGADVNGEAPNGTSALVIAAHSGHPPVVVALLDKGADPNRAGSGYAPLHAAVLRGDLDSVRALLAHGANPNIRLARGTPARAKSLDWALSIAWLDATPVWLAAKFGEVPIMRALLESGADLRLTNQAGTTPVMASIAGVIDRWGEEAADLNYINRMPGQVQEEKTILDSLKVMVEKGADVNAANKIGDTALHGAASRRLENVVRFLVEHGARVDVKNQAGETPLALALSGRLVEYTDILKNGRPARPRPAQPGTKLAKTADLLRELGATE